MASQLEVLRLVAPEFAAISDTDVQSFLDMAPLFIDPMRYPEASRGLILVYQACSLMYRQGLSSGSISGGSGGSTLTREKEGDLERAWGKSSNKSADSKFGERNIYDIQLDQLTLGVDGAPIMTRYGETIPQGIEVTQNGLQNN